MPTNAPLPDCLPCLFIHLAPVDSPSLSWIHSRNTLLFWGGPLMSIAFCAHVIFWMLLPGSWLGVLLESTPGAYPVPHHTPCAFSPTSYIATEPTWTLGEGRLSNNPILNTWVPHYTALECIHCSWEDDRDRALARALECRSCSLPQPKGRASCTTKGTSVIGTFQPRSSDISS